MKNYIHFFTLMNILIFLSSPIFAGELNIMTENLPPFNFEENGALKGISADILKTIMNKSGQKMNEIKVYPWARAYDTIQKDPDTVLFSVARTAERESLFKWVGPVYKLVIGAIGKKGTAVNGVADLNKYKIGTVRDGAPEQLLIKEGIDATKLDRTGDPNSNIKKLEAGRIDLFVFNVPTAKYLMKNQGVDGKQFDVVYVLKEAELYIAFNKSVDDALIAKLQKELDALKASGEYDKIVAKYL